MTHHLPVPTPPPPDPVTRRAFMAITRVDKAMLKGHAMDGAGPDHLQMRANPCGIVMQLDLDDAWRATSAKVGAKLAAGGAELQHALHPTAPHSTPQCPAAAPARCQRTRGCQQHGWCGVHTCGPCVWSA